MAYGDDIYGDEEESIRIRRHINSNRNYGGVRYIFIGSYVLMSTYYSMGLSLLIWLLGVVITLVYGLICA